MKKLLFMHWLFSYSIHIIKFDPEQFGFYIDCSIKLNNLQLMFSPYIDYFFQLSILMNN